MTKLEPLSGLSNEQKSAIQKRFLAARLNLSDRVRVLRIIPGIYWRSLRWAIRRREFWEEIGTYAKPIIIGIIAAAIMAAYPAEAWQGARAGAAVSAILGFGKVMLGKG